MDIKENMVLVSEQSAEIETLKKKPDGNFRAENYSDWNKNWKMEMKDQRVSKFSGRINRNDPIWRTQRPMSKKNDPSPRDFRDNIKLSNKHKWSAEGDKIENGVEKLFEKNTF